MALRQSYWMVKVTASTFRATRRFLAGVPEEDREFVTGIWPPEFERILNGESAAMLAQDAQLGKL